MNEQMIDRIIENIDKPINALCTLKCIDPFVFHYEKKIASDNEFSLIFKCGYYKSPGNITVGGTTKTLNWKYYYTAKLSFIRQYEIFYGLATKTYSEKEINPTADTEDEEVRVIKRILALVWNLYRHIYEESKKDPNTEFEETIAAPQKTRIYYGEFNSLDDPLGSITVGPVH